MDELNMEKSDLIKENEALKNDLNSLESVLNKTEKEENWKKRKNKFRKTGIYQEFKQKIHKMKIMK